MCLTILDCLIVIPMQDSEIDQSKSKILCQDKLWVSASDPQLCITF